MFFSKGLLDIEYELQPQTVCSRGEGLGGMIGHIAVHPDYQNRGIGTVLLQKMLLTLENRRVPSFCLDSGYKQAQMIWQKKFGQPDIVLENYWGTNNHHMIWKRTLPFRL